MRKVVLFDQNQIPEALSNICFKKHCTAEELQLALLDTNTADEFLQKAIELTGLPWKICKDTEELVQLKREDSLGNIDFLKALKNKTNNISEKQINQARMILRNNGVDKNIVDDVLDVINRILYNKSLFSE